MSGEMVSNPHIKLKNMFLYFYLNCKQVNEYLKMKITIDISNLYKSKVNQSCSLLLLIIF